eukprot:Hpha_TRINITY_DN16518_c1_g2::TRINITY_DN16518_c1_g2_i1::g.134181::m.134181
MLKQNPGGDGVFPGNPPPPRIFFFLVCRFVAMMIDLSELTERFVAMMIDLSELTETKGNSKGGFTNAPIEMDWAGSRFIRLGIQHELLDFQFSKSPRWELTLVRGESGGRGEVELDVKKWGGGHENGEM